MKILFVGVGLTQYSNQILNKLGREPEMEIFNLVASKDLGYAKEAIHQTRQGLEFKVVELEGKVSNRFSARRFLGFRRMDRLLESLRPDIVVTGEVYLRMFAYDRSVAAAVKKHQIKIILKDIPFRLDPYDVAKEKIVSGERDLEYTPAFFGLVTKGLKKMRLSDIAEKLEKSFAILLRKRRAAIGRKILLQKLEEKKNIYNFPDAHVNYVEKAFDIFGSYGVPREKIFITYNSPDTDILFDVRKKIESEPPILPLSPHRLIHVGRLIPWKRVDMLIESHAKLKADFRDTELLIVGYGPEEASLRALAKNLGLGDSVRFVGGAYDPRTLGKYLLASSIYVLAGMGGISINDAMAFGRPIICSVCDGTEVELVREGYNGLYFKEGSLKDLTEKIKYLFDRPELLYQMGENSTEIIKNEINISVVVSGYMKAFEYAINLR